MVRIRLRRVGKPKQPIYRVVIADSRSPRDGRFIEIIGQYNPLTEPSQITIDNDKALGWLRKGAQPSESVKALLKRTGIWSEYVKDKGPPPKPPKRKKTAVPAPKAAAEAEPSKAEPSKAEPSKAEPSKAAPAEEAPAEAPAEEPAAEAPAEVEEGS